VEDFHDCEYQDATEGYLDDLDAGEEIPHRPITSGANPLVSRLLYVHVCYYVVLFWTFSRVFSEVVLPRSLRSQHPQRSAGSSWRRG